MIRTGAQLQIEVCPTGRRAVPIVVTFTGGETLTDELNLASLDARNTFLASFPDNTKDEARPLLEELAAELARMPKPTADEDDLQGHVVALQDPEPWADPVDGAQVLDELAATFRRFVALPEGGAEALALWTMHAHAHDAAQVSPLLGIVSPEKRCGKTTALELLGTLVPRALPAANITSAALFRTIEKFRPTLLVDEADTFLADRDELRGILNSGHSRASAVVVRTAGDDFEPRTFSTWAPKAIAMIGDLPDTLADRAIGLRLRRCTRAEAERLEELRLDRLREFEPLRRRCWRWARDHVDALRAADPALPGALHDRAADNWRPLLAIADVAGNLWAERARQTASVLSGDGADGTGGSTRTTLLADIRRVFGGKGSDRLQSTALVEALVAMEDRPWPEFRKGRPLTVRQLAQQLAHFGVRPKALWIDGRTQNGYERAAFADPWARYCPSDPQGPQESSIDAENSLFSIPKESPPLGDPEMPGNTDETDTLGDLGDPEPPLERSGDGPGLWDGPPPSEPAADEDLEPSDVEHEDALDGAPEPGLEVTALGRDRYEVTGGAEPHVVELGTGTGVRCDCKDFAYRGRVRDCKHVAAVQRSLARADENPADQDEGTVLAPAGADDKEPHWRREEQAVAPPGELPVNDGGVGVLDLEPADDDAIPF